jgi:hypothetical protein
VAFVLLLLFNQLAHSFSNDSSIFCEQFARTFVVNINQQQFNSPTAQQLNSSSTNQPLAQWVTRLECSQLIPKTSNRPSLGRCLFSRRITTRSLCTQKQATLTNLSQLLLARLTDSNSFPTILSRSRLMLLNERVRLLSIVETTETESCHCSPQLRRQDSR